MCALVRRDHEDLDRALVAMVDPLTPPAELSNLLDVFRLALAVHSAAEANVMDVLLERAGSPRTLSILAMQTRVEHAAQRAAAESLALLRPASIAWYSHALELRVLVLDHGSRSDHLRWSLEDLPSSVQHSLAGNYATQRLRVLASTSPLAIARKIETTRPFH
ncbi:MAG TPA: hypothetical protein VMZ53_23420 [Kofleriaceae bacterium]|nr:hypothetical protein [Kofleriaceae bacterium]